MQTTLGQTIYTKTFQPKNISIQSHQSKETVSIPQQVMTRESKKFVLNLMDISELLGVDQLFVEQIGKYVTDMKDRNGL